MQRENEQSARWGSRQAGLHSSHGQLLTVTRQETPPPHHPPTHPNHKPNSQPDDMCLRYMHGQAQAAKACRLPCQMPLQLGEGKMVAVAVHACRCGSSLKVGMYQVVGKTQNGVAVVQCRW